MTYEDPDINIPDAPDDDTDDELFWEWEKDEDNLDPQLDLEFRSIEFDLNQIEIVEDHLELRPWEDWEDEEKIQAEISQKPSRKRFNDDEI